MNTIYTKSIVELTIRSSRAVFVPPPALHVGMRQDAISFNLLSGEEGLDVVARTCDFGHPTEND